MKKSPRQSERRRRRRRRRRLLRIFYPSEYFEDKNDEIVDDVYGWIFRNDDDDDDDKNDDEIWNCVLSEIGEIKRAKRIGKICFGVLTFFQEEEEEEEFDDVLFVSVSREAIDAVVTTNCSTNNNIKKQNKKGLDSILEALSFSSCAFYERQQQQQQQQNSSSSKSSSSNATTISMTFVTKFLQKMLDEYECVPYFYTQKTQNWKGGRLRRKPISRVSTTLRLLATRLKAIQQKGFTTRWVWWFFCDVFLARIFFARIASRVQMVSSGFINGDYLIRNADWLAKGNPLGVKLHVPLARTLSGLAKVLAEGYASILGVRKLDTIVVRIIGERLWILGLTTQLACLSDCLFLFTSHAAALHVYSSLLVHFQIAFGKFCYEAGFGANKGRQKKRQSTESLVFGVLFVPPIFLFFPTTFAYFASYLVLHAVALLVRAFLVSCVVYSFDDFDDDDDDFFFDVVYNNNNSYTLSIKKKKKKRRRRRSIDIINNMITKDFVNALRSFGRLPVAFL